MRLVCGGVVAASILFGHLSKAAADPAIAREQLKIGYALSSNGKCGQALPHLLESLRLDPKAITLINLADCEERLGRLAGAMVHWGDARRRARMEKVEPIESEAAARAEALSGRVPRLTIALAAQTPSDTVDERDGVVLGPPSHGIPLPLNPGTHEDVVWVNGLAPIRKRLTIKEAEVRHLEVGPASGEPKAPARRTDQGTHPVAFAGLGTATVALALGATTGIAAMNAASEADRACPDHICEQGAFQEVRRARTLGTISTFSFVGAGIGAAVGIYGLLFGRTRAIPSEPDESVDVAIGPTGLALGGRFE